MTLPEHPDQITPDWLTVALAERHPGTEVTAVDVLEIHAGTNANARLSVGYAANPDGLSSRMFAKLPPLDPDRRAQINQTGMGRREALFYLRLAQHVPMRVLQAYVAAFKSDTGAFVLLLEDLDSSGCSLPDPVAGVPLAYAQTVMEHYAGLHARYEDPARRVAEADWVPAAGRGSDYGQRLLQYGLDNHRQKLSDRFAELSLLYIHHGDPVHDAWAPGGTAGPATVLQGDGHVGNLFVTETGGPGFLDWGLVNVGAPMRDVSYFLNMSLAPELRRAHEHDLIRRYLSARETAGAQPIAFEEAWFAHRVHAAYTVPASCQVVTFPADASPARQRFAAAFLARAEAAIADLDARAALAEAVGV